jgi:hypothetical protein
MTLTVLQNVEPYLALMPVTATGDDFAADDPSVGLGPETPVGVLGFNHWDTIGREGVEAGKARVLPVTTVQDHRHHTRLLGIVQADRLSQLHIVAIVRSQEIGTDQKEHDIGATQGLIDGASPFTACRDLAIVPESDETFILSGAQVFAQPLVVRFVGMRIRQENFPWHGHGFETSLKERPTTIKGDCA